MKTHLGFTPTYLNGSLIEDSVVPCPLGAGEHFAPDCVRELGAARRERQGPLVRSQYRHHSKSINYATAHGCAKLRMAAGMGRPKKSSAADFDAS
jgi:hypothetical protein